MEYVAERAAFNGGSSSNNRLYCAISPKYSLAFCALAKVDWEKWYWYASRPAEACSDRADAMRGEWSGLGDIFRETFLCCCRCCRRLPPVLFSGTGPSLGGTG